MIPYIILCSPPLNFSSGHKCLRLLNKKLNERGCKSVTWGGEVENDQFHLLPEICKDTSKFPVIKKMIDDGAIVVYPGIFEYNFLNSKRPVQWNLSWQKYKVIKMQFHHHREFPGATQILCIDWIEHNLFNKIDLPEKKGSCAYQGKTAGDILHDYAIFDNRMLITKTEPKTRKEVAELLRKCKYFYSYDGHTGLMNEAALCGTVSIFIPNKSQWQPKYLISYSGIALNTSKGEIDKATRTLDYHEIEYKKYFIDQEDLIDNFINITQKMEAR